MSLAIKFLSAALLAAVIAGCTTKELIKIEFLSAEYIFEASTGKQQFAAASSSLSENLKFCAPDSNCETVDSGTYLKSLRIRIRGRADLLKYTEREASPPNFSLYECGWFLYDENAFDEPEDVRRMRTIKNSISDIRMAQSVPNREYVFISIIPSTVIENRFSESISTGIELCARVHSGSTIWPWGSRLEFESNEIRFQLPNIPE